MKTNFKKGIFIILLVCTALIASAAQDRIVYLKNGSIIKGSIVEHIPNVSLKIQTADGSIFSYQMDDIEKIDKEEVDKYKTNFDFDGEGLKRGYRGFIDFGYTIGTGRFDVNRVELSTSHGYQFNPYFFVGIGVGFHFYHDSYDGSLVEIPFFAHLRSELMNNAVSPFIDFKVGYSVYDNTGYYVTPSVGCRIAINDKYGISASLGYTAQKLLASLYWKENCGGFCIKASFDF